MSVRRWAYGLRTYSPISRKPLLTVLVLSVMGFALVSLSRPYGTGLFSLGVLLLSSDYGILKTIGLERPYDWIEANDTFHERIERNYRAKKYRAEGPSRLELHPQTGRDLRARVEDEAKYLFEEMPFRVYVEAPSTGTDEDLNYHLQLASAELTRLSDHPESGVTAFFTITDWETEFEDEQERRCAEKARENVESGDSDVVPFGKVRIGERVNEFELDEWQAIYDWSKGESSVTT
jgi:hypothetical protein